MQKSQYKSWLAVWIPFGLRRIDFYFIRFYLKAFLLILFAIAALVAIGDMFQRFDDFVILSRRENQDFETMIKTFLLYYSSFVPQLIFQYMFPAVMLLAASITATTSFAGPRGNNEYIVIRSAGIPVLRSFFPLLFSAFLVALTFQATRDQFLPDMVRDSYSILNRLRNKTGNPIGVTVVGDETMHSVALGTFTPDRVGHNVLIEVRNPEAFRRGDSGKGDNDFLSYRAAAARLDPAPDGGYQWVPLENAQEQAYSQFSRRAKPWTEPLQTDLTPAMIERQTLGDAVCSWQDLLAMRATNAGARFEMHWRLADPIACCLLILWGSGLCMGRMLRGKGGSYIHAVSVSMVAAALFYILRLAGKTLWESGNIGAAEGVWYPIAAAALVALPIALWMER